MKIEDQMERLMDKNMEPIPNSPLLLFSNINIWSNKILSHISMTREAIKNKEMVFLSHLPLMN